MTHMRSESTFEPLYAEDIALAMEMRTAGASDFDIYVHTGATAMDLFLAEEIGTDAYPVRAKAN